MGGQSGLSAFLRLGIWKMVYLRVFVHRNLWKSTAEIRNMRTRKTNKRRKELYGTTSSLVKKYGWSLVKRDGPYCKGHECNKKIFPQHPDFSVDHIIPASKGGATELSNLQIMCKPCNVDKADFHYEHKEEKKEVGYKAFAYEFEKLGITPENIGTQSPTRAQKSKTSV